MPDQEGSAALLALLKTAEIVPAAVLDAQLLGWSKSTHNKSPQITLQLATDDDIAPFEMLTLAKGKVAGQLLSIVVFTYDGAGGYAGAFDAQDDKPPQGVPNHQENQTNASQSDSVRPEQGALCKLAGIFCVNPQFWFWIGQNYEGRYANEAHAAAFVRGLCGIQSRRELDTDARAENTFHHEIRKPFSEWVKQQAAKQPKPE